MPIRFACCLLALACASAAAEVPSPLYDPDNADGHLLQRVDAAIPPAMRDKSGKPDWMRLIDSNSISPRATLDGKGTMSPLQLDILMKNTKEMPWVKFPHRSHTLWLDCSNCHDAIFVAKAGANEINMTRIFRGEACGACHGRVAFQPFVACERCHSVPQGAIPAWWGPEK